MQHAERTMTVADEERDDWPGRIRSEVIASLTAATADVLAVARRTVLIALGATVVVAETTARVVAAARAWRPPVIALGSLERKR